jgi:hypothetical protein
VCLSLELLFTELAAYIFSLQVSVSVAKPEPSELESWGIVGKGFGGGIGTDSRYGAIIDVGGVHNVHYMANHDKSHWDVNALTTYAYMTHRNMREPVLIESWFVDAQ